MEMRFDVGAAAALGEPCHIAGTLFPPTVARDGPLVIALLVPGGGYARRYYDLHVDGHAGYSAALRLAERGIVAVAIDSLGTGESSIPEDGRRVTLDIQAATLAEVARQLREAARAGTLLPSVPAREPVVIGIGHSLGGCTITLQQGDHAVCDAVAILGFSCQYIRTAVDPKTGERLRPRIPASREGYNRSDPASHRDRFYTASVPRAVIEAEEAARVAMPDGVAEVLIPGRSAPAAARIDVPVLLGFGEFDVSPDPHAEPGFYRSSRDVTLLVLPDAAHCHNSASGRAGFWRRIGDWIDMVAAGPATA
ncbi:alpha/beta fold hydrolase [Rhizorhabdus wittichii]|uniref:Alpha/beta fold hydrolase n=1 Tax=Rhizorhabdus wittichii TaxID=160791 RepID=A0A975HDF6_9SPHN|nr:alpha/beta fold hydrolase [Rhizorhabdus wittichii]QTH21223.1 alpha/beta fold hydrolase [Rhizorhabdus wittichii]